jgi:hypothetical protein
MKKKTLNLLYLPVLQRNIQIVFGFPQMRILSKAK